MFYLIDKIRGDLPARLIARLLDYYGANAHGHD